MVQYKFVRLALDSHNLHKQNSCIKMSLCGKLQKVTRTVLNSHAVHGDLNTIISQLTHASVVHYINYCLMSYIVCSGSLSLSLPLLLHFSSSPPPILIIITIAFYLPICHKELGPATEYGCLLTNPAGNLLRPPNGSMDLRVLRTRSLVTFMPLARRLPQIICTPEYEQSCLICWICDTRSSLLISFSGSCNRPYSSLRLQ